MTLEQKFNALFARVNNVFKILENSTEPVIVESEDKSVDIKQSGALVDLSIKKQIDDLKILIENIDIPAVDLTLIEQAISAIETTMLGINDRVSALENTSGAIYQHNVILNINTGQGYSVKLGTITLYTSDVTKFTIQTLAWYLNDRAFTMSNANLMFLGQFRGGSDFYRALVYASDGLLQASLIKLDDTGSVITTSISIADDIVVIV